MRIDRRLCSHMYARFWLSFLSLGMVANQGVSSTHDSHSDSYISAKDLHCEKNSSKESCYRELYCSILSLTSSTKGSDEVQCEERLESQKYFEGSYKGFSKYQLQTTKPNTIFLAIHGLWGTSSQFSTSLKRYNGYRETPYNLIQLSLPGHRKSDIAKENKSAYEESLKDGSLYASRHQWKRAVKDTLEIASQLADNVVLVGQSTGALLALIASIEQPDLVDQLILIEPALKVRSLMNLGACATASTIPTSFVKVLGDISGTHIPNGLSVQMGCEVQKLADDYIERRFVRKVVGGPSRSKFVRVELYTPYETFAEKVPVPILMINNQKDKIVDPDINEIFFAAIPTTKKYIGINSDGSSPHGKITSGGAYYLATEIFRFLYEAAPTSNLGSVYRRHLLGWINKNLINMCYISTGAQACQRISTSIKKHSKKQLPYICSALASDELCDKLYLAFKAYEDFRTRYSHWIQLYGTKLGTEKMHEAYFSKEGSHYQELQRAKSYLTEISEELKKPYAHPAKR